MIYIVIVLCLLAFVFYATVKQAQIKRGKLDLIFFKTEVIMQQSKHTSAEEAAGKLSEPPQITDAPSEKPKATTEKCAPVVKAPLPKKEEIKIRYDTGIYNCEVTLEVGESEVEVTALHSEQDYGSGGLLGWYHDINKRTFKRGDYSNVRSLYDAVVRFISTPSAKLYFFFPSNEVKERLTVDMLMSGSEKARYSAQLQRRKNKTTADKTPQATITENRDDKKNKPEKPQNWKLIAKALEESYNDVKIKRVDIDFLTEKGGDDSARSGDDIVYYFLKIKKKFYREKYHWDLDDPGACRSLGKEAISSKQLSKRMEEYARSTMTYGSDERKDYRPLYAMLVSWCMTDLIPKEIPKQSSPYEDDGSLCFYFYMKWFTHEHDFYDLAARFHHPFIDLYAKKNNKGETVKSILEFAHPTQVFSVTIKIDRECFKADFGSGGGIIDFLKETNLSLYYHFHESYSFHDGGGSDSEEWTLTRAKEKALPGKAMTGTAYQGKRIPPNNGFYDDNGRLLLVEPFDLRGIFEYSDSAKSTGLDDLY